MVDARADLDIVLDDDPSDLRHLEVATGAEREAETVLADMGAGMNDHAVADQGRGDRRGPRRSRRRGRSARQGR